MQRPSFRAIGVFTLIFSAGSLLQSCTEEEVAVGAAVVAVGAAAASVSSSRGRTCRSSRTRCHVYTDYYGNRVRECRRSTRRCYNHLESMSALALASAVEELPIDDLIDADDLSAEYSMSVESAQRLIDALKEAKQGSLEGINALGLTREDVESMAQLKVPEQEAIDRLAQNLNQDPILTKGVLSRIVLHGHKLRKEECAKAPSERRIGGGYDHYCVNNP